MDAGAEIKEMEAEDWIRHTLERSERRKSLVLDCQAKCRGGFANREVSDFA
jgi:hypothetical protein